MKFAFRTFLTAVCLVAASLFSFAIPAQAATYYVPDDFQTIASAITFAVNDDTILVKPGRYFENLTISKNITLQSTDGASTTIIDGNQAGTVIYVTSGALPNITGFTVTNGYGWGGGMFIQGGRPIIKDCVITGNTSSDRGGGVIVNYYACGVIFDNVEISNNYAPGEGGGIWGIACCVTMVNSRIINNISGSNGGGVASTGWCSGIHLDRCEISGNQALGNGGGLISGWGSGCGSNVRVNNSLIVNNISQSAGGGVCADTDGYAAVSNSTVAGNKAPIGGGFYAASVFAIDSSIIWGNDTLPLFPAGTGAASYSDIEGGVLPPGEGNISADPLFVDPDNSDYRLRYRSPAIDQVAAGPAIDFLGMARPQGSSYDMGAYEMVLPDADGDGFDAHMDCNDGNPAINPAAAEIPYNGIDENCSGMADDDDLDHDGYLMVNDCNDLDPLTHPGAPEIAYDGKDQDCNGYDLTIRINKAEWSKSKRSVTVEASSTYGAGAALRLATYNIPMTWNDKRKMWTATKTGVNANPGTINVSGREGSMSKTVSTVK